jgi:hypothetical protein
VSKGLRQKPETSQPPHSAHASTLGRGGGNFGPHARRKVGLYHVSQYISGGSHTVGPVDTIYGTKPLSDVATQQEGEPLVAVLLGHKG